MEENEQADVQNAASEDGVSNTGDTVSLGGNITLNGFKDLEKAKLVVLKKMIGNSVKEIQEKKSDYESIAITFEGDESNATIKIDLTAGGNTLSGEDNQNNIFMALNGALKKVTDQF